MEGDNAIIRYSPSAQISVLLFFSVVSELVGVAFIIAQALDVGNIREQRALTGGAVLIGVGFMSFLLGYRHYVHVDLLKDCLLFSRGFPHFGVNANFKYAEIERVEISSLTYAVSLRMSGRKTQTLPAGLIRIEGKIPELPNDPEAPLGGYQREMFWLGREIQRRVAAASEIVSDK